jgi:hypothetical protein
MRADLWRARFLWDDAFYMAANGYLRLRYLLRGGARAHGLPDNARLKNAHQGGRAFVVGNGPSIAGQDLKALKDEVTFFVNRSFLHEDYATIRPTYHVFIDPKLATGEWPVTFLDEAAARNPDVTFLLDGAWRGLEAFRPYRGKYRIHWIQQKLFFQPYFRGPVDLTRIGPGGAVVEQGVLAAVYMGVRDVFLLGVDANGLCYDLIKQSSHFYGSNPENLTKGFQDIYRDLAAMSSSLRRWEMIARHCARAGVHLVNLTDGGILDICPRANYKDVVTSARQ